MFPNLLLLLLLAAPAWASVEQRTTFLAAESPTSVPTYIQAQQPLPRADAYNRLTRAQASTLAMPLGELVAQLAVPPSSAAAGTPSTLFYAFLSSSTGTQASVASLSLSTNEATPVLTLPFTEDLTGVCVSADGAHLALVSFNETGGRSRTVDRVFVRLVDVAATQASAASSVRTFIFKPTPGTRTTGRCALVPGSGVASVAFSAEGAGQIVTFPAASTPMRTTFPLPGSEEDDRVMLDAVWDAAHGRLVVVQPSFSTSTAVYALNASDEWSSSQLHSSTNTIRAVDLHPTTGALWTYDNAQLLCEVDGGCVRIARGSTGHGKFRFAVVSASADVAPVVGVSAGVPLSMQGLSTAALLQVDVSARAQAVSPASYKTLLHNYPLSFLLHSPSLASLFFAANVDGDCDGCEASSEIYQATALDETADKWSIASIVQRGSNAKITSLAFDDDGATLFWVEQRQVNATSVMQNFLMSLDVSKAAAPVERFSTLLPHATDTSAFNLFVHDPSTQDIVFAAGSGLFRWHAAPGSNLAKMDTSRISTLHVFNTTVTALGADFGRGSVFLGVSSDEQGAAIFECVLKTMACHAVHSFASSDKVAQVGSIAVHAASSTLWGTALRSDGSTEAFAITYAGAPIGCSALVTFLRDCVSLPSSPVCQVHPYGRRTALVSGDAYGMRVVTVGSCSKPAVVQKTAAFPLPGIYTLQLSLTNHEQMFSAMTDSVEVLFQNLLPVVLNDPGRALSTPYTVRSTRLRSSMRGVVVTAEYLYTWRRLDGSAYSMCGTSNVFSNFSFPSFDKPQCYTLMRATRTGQDQFQPLWNVTNTIMSNGSVAMQDASLGTVDASANLVFLYRAACKVPAQGGGTTMAGGCIEMRELTSGKYVRHVVLKVMAPGVQAMLADSSSKTLFWSHGGGLSLVKYDGTGLHVAYDDHFHGQFSSIARPASNTGYISCLQTYTTTAGRTAWLTQFWPLDTLDKSTSLTLSTDYVHSAMQVSTGNADESFHVIFSATAAGVEGVVLRACTATFTFPFADGTSCDSYVVLLENVEPTFIGNIANTTSHWQAWSANPAALPSRSILSVDVSPRAESTEPFPPFFQRQVLQLSEPAEAEPSPGVATVYPSNARSRFRVSQFRVSGDSLLFGTGIDVWRVDDLSSKPTAPQILGPFASGLAAPPSSDTLRYNTESSSVEWLADGRIVAMHAASTSDADSVVPVSGFSIAPPASIPPALFDALNYTSFDSASDGYWIVLGDNTVVTVSAPNAETQYAANTGDSSTLTSIAVTDVPVPSGGGSLFVADTTAGAVLELRRNVSMPAPLLLPFNQHKQVMSLVDVHTGLGTKLNAPVKLASIRAKGPQPASGCTAPCACNYDPRAVVDDGSCDTHCCARVAARWTGTWKSISCNAEACCCPKEIEVLLNTEEPTPRLKLQAPEVHEGQGPCPAVSVSYAALPDEESNVIAQVELFGVSYMVTRKFYAQPEPQVDVTMDVESDGGSTTCKIMGRIDSKTPPPQGGGGGGGGGSHTGLIVGVTVAVVVVVAAAVFAYRRWKKRSEDPMTHRLVVENSYPQYH